MVTECDLLITAPQAHWTQSELFQVYAGVICAADALSTATLFMKPLGNSSYVTALNDQSSSNI